MTKETNPRPKWSRDDISEADAKWFRNNYVIGIDLKREFYDCDKSREWLELCVEKGCKRVVGKKIERLPDCVKFQPNWRELIQLDRWVADEIDRLAAWDRQHAKDIAELKRLQEKLYGA